MANSVIATHYGNAVYEELPAAAELLPGTGLEVTTDAEGNEQVQPVSSAGQAAARFARTKSNPPYASDSDTSPIEQAYPDGDNVEYETMRVGDKVRARVAAGSDLTTAANANIAPGDPLNFHSDGTLKVAGSRASAVAVARSATDNSGAASGENPVALVQVV